MANDQRAPCKFAVAVAAALFAAGLASCGHQPQATPAPEVEREEIPLADQAMAVREGITDQLKLVTTMVTDKDLSHLDGLEQNLRAINFSLTQISDDGLARLCEFGQLEQLRISSSRISDDALPALAKLSKLKYLHLIDRSITDEGLAHLAALKNLESLYVDKSQTSDEAREKLDRDLDGVHIHFDGGHAGHDPHTDEDAAKGKS